MKYLKSITCDPLLYTMYQSDLIVSTLHIELFIDFTGKLSFIIGQKINNPIVSLTSQLLYGKIDTCVSREACSTMRALRLLSSAFSLNASTRYLRCVQALAIQVHRCIARKSKMATKTIMVFVRDYARNIFRFDFCNDDVCFFVWIYEMEQFKPKV